MNAHNLTLPPHAAAAHTILLVEDEALIALNEKIMLQQHGFTVLTAANGMQAVEMALGTPQLDLILMDINLGADLDGSEAAQQILAQRDVPIVFLSSHTEPDVVEKTEKITSYGYVVKNSGETVLIASVKMALKLFDAHQRLKRQEATLREREAYIRNISNNLSSGMIYQLVRRNDGSRAFTYVSDVVQRFYGCTPQEALADANLIYNRVYPEDRLRVWQGEEEANRTLSPFKMEVRMLTPTGGMRWSAFVSSPHKLADGSTCWDGIEFDITERKRVEEALRESEGLLNAAGYMARVGGWKLDAQTLEVRWTAETYRIHEVLPDYTPSLQEALNFFHPDDRGKLADAIQRALDTGEPYDLEVRFITAQGNFLWTRTVCQPQVVDGKVSTLKGIFQDITDRKRAEEALRKSEQQLRELNAQKDKFFSILAHDLKNPLAGFLAFANLLELDFDRIAPAERNTFIQHFRASAELLMTLLENLLTWACLQNGQAESVPDVFPLDHVAARAVALLAPNAAHKQISLTNVMPAVTVYADLSMTDAVMRNLLVNAIKFTPAGGTVTVSATHTATDVCVTVADTGIGMPPEKVAQLFRIDGKTQRDGTSGEKGTGLGLILCKEFVEKQGGRIWAESEPGNGTRMRFTLPVKPG